MRFIDYYYYYAKEFVNQLNPGDTFRAEQVNQYVCSMSGLEPLSPASKGALFYHFSKPLLEGGVIGDIGYTRCSRKHNHGRPAKTYLKK